MLSGADESSKFVQSIELSTPVLTPNGDGINDQLEIRYSLFRLPGPVPVALEVYTLDGHRIARIEGGLQDSGPRHLLWDGRDETGQLLKPGLYLFSIVLTTQTTQARPLQVLGIAY